MKDVNQARLGLILGHAEQTARTLADLEKSLPGNPNIFLARQSAEKTVDFIRAALQQNNPLPETSVT